MVVNNRKLQKIKESQNIFVSMKRNPELDTSVLEQQEKDNKSTPNHFQGKTNDAFILEAERTNGGMS